VFSFFSIRIAQEAQVMPPISSSMPAPAVGGADVLMLLFLLLLVLVLMADER
jgi:hypothetical protein